MRTLRGAIGSVSVIFIVIACACAGSSPARAGCSELLDDALEVAPCLVCPCTLVPAVLCAALVDFFSQAAAVRAEVPLVNVNVNVNNVNVNVNVNVDASVNVDDVVTPAAMAF